MYKTAAARWCAGLLALCLLLGLTAVPARAADDTFTVTYRTNAEVEMGTVTYNVGETALPPLEQLGTLFRSFVVRAAQKGDVAVPPENARWYLDAEFTQPITQLPAGEAGQNYTVYCKFTTGLKVASLKEMTKNPLSYGDQFFSFLASIGVNWSASNDRNDQEAGLTMVFEKQLEDGTWEAVDASYGTDMDGNVWKNAIFFRSVADSGTYRLKRFYYTATDNNGDVLYYDYAEVPVNKTLSVVITPVELTISGVQAVSRAANGSTAVELTGGELQGIVRGDDVGFSLGTGSVADAAAGENKAVTTNIQLTGEKAENYTLVQPSDLTVNIREASTAAPGGSDEAQREAAREEHRRFEAVKGHIASARAGETVTMQADGLAQLPYDVMLALYERGDVSLRIRWDGGEDILIPAGGAVKPEQGRVYYPLAQLAEQYAAWQPEKNPSTGAVPGMMGTLGAVVLLAAGCAARSRKK